MISGANEEELELASARMDIMLATNYTPDNPGPLAIIDKYHDKEIERLNNIINELKKGLIKEIDSLQDVEVESKEDIRCRTLCDVLDKLSDLIGELKEGKE